MLLNENGRGNREAIAKVSKSLSQDIIAYIKIINPLTSPSEFAKAYLLNFILGMTEDTALLMFFELTFIFFLTIFFI